MASYNSDMTSVAEEREDIVFVLDENSYDDDSIEKIDPGWELILYIFLFCFIVNCCLLPCCLRVVASSIEP